MEKFLNIRSTEEIPLPYREVFSEYVHFNTVQSEVLDDVFDSDDSIVLSSPTGSGKTTVFELAVVRLLMQYGSSNSDFKIIYISPIKSLCQERLVDWNKKFSNFGINCICVTGDTDNADFHSLFYHNLIISTPEKWDSLTRKWREHEKLVKVIKLFMIDEVHLLNEEDRGSTLEVIVSRMKTVQSSLSLNNVTDSRIRFIAVSATIGNVEDIAEWIGSPKYFRFPEDMRPVQLKKLVIGFSSKQTPSSAFKFDLSLNYRLQSLLITHSEGKPTLIFCSTRKSVEMTAKHLVQTLNIKLDPFKLQTLQHRAVDITDVKIKEMLRHGIGVHHAGMDFETRRAIEELFRNGDLPILIATSTLAMGVNLPAHLVIIKSTKYYVNGTIQDYSTTAIHQMIGRAGRPQFDTTATALILTTNEDKSKIEKMLSATEPVESNLHRHLVEHLNAEVVLGTITGLDVAMQWLASTFLYIRARSNPRHYGLSLAYKKEQLDKKLLEMFQIDLNKLVRAGMITMDENINVSPTMTGRLMASYYVDFETMKMFTQITGNEIFIQILAIISKCQEFSEMRLRVSDKKTLNLLNKNAKKQTIRFPLNGKIKTWDMKVNCIIQAVLGNLEITDASIQTESFTVLRNAKRIIKCLIHYLSTRKHNCYTALLNATILGKCLNAKLWEDSPYVSKQLTGIGSIYATQLANAGKNTFEKILEANPRDIEMIVKRKPPFGDYLIEEVKYLPKFSIRMDKVSQGCQLTIILENVDSVRHKSTLNETSAMTLLVGNDRNETLLHEKYQISYLIEKPELIKIVKAKDNNLGRIEAHFISEDWVGIDRRWDVISNDEAKIEDFSGVPKLSKNIADPKQNSYIQTFLDIYMKIKKPEKSVSVKNKQKNESKKIDKVKIHEKFDDLIKEKVENAIKQNKSIKYLEENQDIVKEDEFSTKNVEIKKPQLTISDLYDLPEGIDSNEDEKPKKCDNLKIEEELAIFSNSFTAASKNDDLQADLDEICLQEKKQKELSKLADQDQDLMNIFNTSSPLSLFEENETKLSNPIDENEKNSQELVTSTENEKKITFDRTHSFDKSLTNSNPLLYALSHKYLTDEVNKETNSVKPVVGRTGKNLTLRNILNNRGKKRKKLNDIHPAEELEDQLFKREERKQKEYLETFKKPSKKKMTHIYSDNNNYLPDSTIGNHPYKMNDLEHRQSFDYNFDNQKKNISWRSPLVISPGIKFSPDREKLDNNLKNDSHNVSLDTTSTIASSKSFQNSSFNIKKTPRRFKTDQNFLKQTPNSSTQFPLSDKDYNNYYSQEIRKPKELDNIEKFSDIFSSQILDGFKMKEKTPARASTKHSPATVCDYYLSETNKSIQKENADLNRSKNKIKVEEIEENDFNASRNLSETDFNFPNDDIIISQNRSISQEYIDAKIRKNYPVYPDFEPNRYSASTPSTVDRRNRDTNSSSVKRAMHYSNYVNPIHSDFPPCYRQFSREIPSTEPMRSYGYAPQYGIRPMGQYGNVESAYGGSYQYELHPPITPTRRSSFSPEESYETFLMRNTIPPSTQSRRFYRTPEVIPEDVNNSFLMSPSTYPVNYNQNISGNIPYGYVPDYQQCQVVDKDYVMSKYWRSFNDE